MNLGPYTADAVLDLLTDGFDVKVETSEEGLTVEGELEECEFVDWGCYLAEVFRAGAALGGEGELWFLNDLARYEPALPELCYRLIVSNGDTKLTHPTMDEQWQIMTTDFA